MSVVIRPVGKAVEHAIKESLRTHVLSRPMIAEIVEAGISSITSDPAGYLAYYNAHAEAGHGVETLESIEDHVEALRRAGQRATSWVGTRRIHIPVFTSSNAETTLCGSYEINSFLRDHIGCTERPEPPRGPSHPEQLGPGAAATLGHKWLNYSRELALWRKSSSAQIQYHRQLAHETVKTLLVDAFGPWLGR